MVHKEVDAVNVFPKKLPVYLRTPQGETRLHELNATFGLQPAATTKAAMMPILLPPTMQQLPGTFLQPVEGVFGGTMVGRAPQTRGDQKKTKCRRGKDKVEIISWRCCKNCTQHGKSLEEASNFCPGKGVRSMCTTSGQMQKGNIARVHIMQ